MVSMQCHLLKAISHGLRQRRHPDFCPVVALEGLRPELIDPAQATGSG
jgi:hypothetical protein